MVARATEQGEGTINHNFITPQLATGGDLPGFPGSTPWRDELEAWYESGITHVVDNRFEYSDELELEEAAPWISYLHNGVDDHGERQPDEWFDRGTAWVDEALEDPEAKVLIHCHMGINRGPSMAYAVLLTQGWDPVAAIAAVRTARPIAYVLYAEDALDWHHRRTGTPRSVREDDRLRLAEWRWEHPLDVVRIIRSIRAGEEPDVA